MSERKKYPNSLFGFTVDPDESAAQQESMKELWRQRGVDYHKFRRGINHIIAGITITPEAQYYVEIKKRVVESGAGVEAQRWWLESVALQAKDGKQRTVHEYLRETLTLWQQGVFGKKK